jgi:hypothetical protein
VSLPPTLEQLRERAAAHNLELSEHEFMSVGDVSAVIRLSQTFVRDIPRDELPFIEFGHGHKLKRRRYRREDVDAYLDRLYAEQNTRSAKRQRGNPR